MENMEKDEKTEFLLHRNEVNQVQTPPFGTNSNNLGIISQQKHCDDFDYKKGVHEKKGYPLWLILCAVSSTVGASAQFGFNTGVITVPAKYMREFYNESHYDRNGYYMEDDAHRWLWSTTVSIYCVGALFGALTAGFFSNKLGRKGALLFSNVFSIISCLFLAAGKLVNIYEFIIVGRFISGFHDGLTNALVPLYMSEIAPTSLRGFICLLHPLLMCIGIWAAQIIGFYMFSQEHEWPVLLSLPPLVLTIFQLVTLPFCPESPRWLFMAKHDTVGAVSALRKFRRKHNVEKEMEQMQEEYEKESCGQRIGIANFIFMIIFDKPNWRLPFLISCVLCIGLQFSGINAVWFYITDIFEAASLTSEQAAMGTIILGFLNVAGTVISSLLIDKVGRRPLTIIPSIFICICCCGITLCTHYQYDVPWLQWVTVGFIGALVLFVSGGPGPMPYVIGSELWSQDPRPAAMSLFAIVNWSSNFAIGMLFPLFSNFMGEYVFLIFATFMILTATFHYFYLPETKNKTFEQIAAIFKKGHKSFYEREGNRHIHMAAIQRTGYKLTKV